MASREELESAARSGAKVFVGNLKRSVYKDDIQELFKDYGTILNIWIAQQPPGFAFVTFKDPEDAKDAVSGTNGKDAEFAERGGCRVEVSTSMPGDSKGKGRRGGNRSRSRSRGRRDDRSRSRGRGKRDSRSRGRGRGRDSRRRR